MDNNRQYGFWTNPKILEQFDTFCKKSEIIRINWKKFNELDKKRVFAQYKNTYLSLMFLKRNRIANEICLSCGDTDKAIYKSHMCKECYTRYHPVNKIVDKTVKLIKKAHKKISDDLELGPPLDD